MISPGTFANGFELRPSDEKRRVVGGSWLDPSYMFEPSHAESFDPAYANEAIGFRCTKPVEE